MLARCGNVDWRWSLPRRHVPVPCSSLSVPGSRSHHIVVVESRFLPHSTVLFFLGDFLAWYKYLDFRALTDEKLGDSGITQLWMGFHPFVILFSWMTFYPWLLRTNIPWLFQDWRILSLYWFAFHELNRIFLFFRLFLFVKFIQIVIFVHAFLFLFELFFFTNYQLYLK